MSFSLSSKDAIIKLLEFDEKSSKQIGFISYFKYEQSSIYVSKLLTIVDGVISIIIDLYTMVISNNVVYYPMKVCWSNHESSNQETNSFIDSNNNHIQH